MQAMANFQDNSSWDIIFKYYTHSFQVIISE